MFKPARCHKPLGPFKRSRRLIVELYKGIDGLPQLLGGSETGSLQRLPAQDAEPAFDLVEPGSVRRRVMKMDAGVAATPAVMFGFMGVQVVHNHMQLLARISRHQTVHEIQEFAPPATVIMSRSHSTFQN